jgi:hypothetical protein
MADLQNRTDKISMRSEIAKLVDGILDDTYKTIDDAQTAFEETRQAPSSESEPKPAANDDAKSAR